MEKEKAIVAYTRVSSAAQNLAMQVGLAKQYMDRENIELSTAIFIDDHDVSATKLSMNDRPGLTEVIKLIKQNKIKKLIVYKRDRLARNFYEYTELAKLFIDYDIDVIFTASNEAPFMKSIVFESFHGMLGQMEGINIKGRTDDARKQYPSNIIGYKRTKSANSVRYTAHPEKADVVTSLFQEASRITSAQMFIKFLIEKHQFKFDQKLKVLTNPFYAGYFQKNELFQKLHYVEPLISLDTFKKVLIIIETYLKDFNAAVLNTPSLLYSLPTCAVCKKTMKYKQSHPLDAGSIYCRNGHKKNEILVIEYNQQISLTLHEELLKISHEQLKKIVTKTLKQEKRKLEQQFKKQHNDYKKALLSLTTSFDSIDRRYDKSLSQLENLKDSISKTKADIVTIEQLILEIKLLVDQIRAFKLDWTQETLSQIAKLLIEEIIVGYDFTSISLFLATKRNEGLSC